MAIQMSQLNVRNRQIQEDEALSIKQQEEEDEQINKSKVKVILLCQGQLIM